MPLFFCKEEIMRTTVLKSYPELDYCLAHLPDNRVTPFVCAFAPNYDSAGALLNWAQGHYFADIDDAFEYIRSLKERRQNNDTRGF